MINRKVLLLLSLLFSISLLGQTADSNNRNRFVEGVYLENSHIRPDGILDEDAWQKGKWQGNFTQYEPRDGQPASCKTEFAFYTMTHTYI